MEHGERREQTPPAGDPSIELVGVGRRRWGGGVAKDSALFDAVKPSMLYMISSSPWWSMMIITILKPSSSWTSWSSPSLNLVRCYQAQHALIDRRFAYFTLWLLFLLWVCRLCCVCYSCFVLCAHTWVLWIYRCECLRLRFMCSLFFPQSQYYDNFENGTVVQIRASLDLPVTSLAMICYLGWSLGKAGGET